MYPIVFNADGKGQISSELHKFIQKDEKHYLELPQLFLLQEKETIGVVADPESG